MIQGELFENATMFFRIAFHLHNCLLKKNNLTISVLWLKKEQLFRWLTL